MPEVLHAPEIKLQCSEEHHDCLWTITATTPRFAQDSVDADDVFCTCQHGVSYMIKHRCGMTCRCIVEPPVGFVFESVVLFGVDAGGAYAES